MQLYNFYSFFPILDVDAAREKIFNEGHACGIHGTVFLAPEGINGALYGEDEVLRTFFSFIQKIFSHTLFPFITHIPPNTLPPFSKLKVKKKSEIVKMGMPSIDPGNPSCPVGRFVNPWEWNDIIAQEDTIIIDTRNSYEYHLGHFKNAINPDTTFFTEFPHFVLSYCAKKKSIARIAMYCTGGIRCEKATSLLIRHGYDDIYHLKNGILEYFRVIPRRHSLWEGVCYVFDGRITIDETMHTTKLRRNTIHKDILQMKTLSRHERHIHRKIMQRTI